MINNYVGNYRSKRIAQVFAAILIIILGTPALAFAQDTNYSFGSSSILSELQNKLARQQVNSITSYLDGSMVYGSDATRAKALRSFVGGKLKTSGDNLMPLNEAGLQNANDAHIAPDTSLFLAGDVRANENPELQAVQTLFVREHNRVAESIAKQNTKLKDEEIFQQARKIVIAELQAITYNEFLPALLGTNALKPYRGYDASVNAGIANEFSTAAYRIGHTLVNDDIEFLDNDGNDVKDEMSLASAFFDPQPLKDVGPAPILKYLSTDNAQEVDLKLIDDLRNFLFGPPGAGGLDLASLNIERGRDHGLSDYNTTRAAYGLSKVKTWSDITKDTDLQAKLKSLYGNVNNIDLWVGGLAEDHAPGTSVGPTFRKIIADQFERIRDGDRFWYERQFDGKTLKALQATKLSDVIKRNTTLTNIQSNVFYYDENAATTTATTSPSLAWTNIFSLSFNDTRSIDGSGNNRSHTDWGKAGTDLLRLAPAAYADGKGAPGGANRPSPRLISNTLSAQTDGVPNDRHMSDWVYAWGQFIDHDLDLTQTGTETLAISVPKGDPQFDPLSTGLEIMPFTRSAFDSKSGIGYVRGTLSTSTLEKIKKFKSSRFFDFGSHF